MKPFRFLGGLLLIAVVAFGEEQDPFEAGRSALADGRLAEARQSLEKALEAEPENRFGLVQLAYVYYLQGDSEKAQSFLRSVLGGGEDTVSLLMLGDLVYRSRDFAAAREIYLRLDALDPGLRIVNIRLYEMFRYEDRDRAHRYYLRSLQLPPTDVKDYIGLPGTGPGFVYSESDRPVRRDPVLSGSPVSNDLVRYFTAEDAVEEDASRTNLTVLGQTRVGRDRTPVRILRAVRMEKFVARLLGSGIILIGFLVSGLFGKGRPRGGGRRNASTEVVFSQYRKKGQPRRIP